MSWRLRLTSLPRGRTWMQVRVRGTAEPWWLSVAYIVAQIPAGEIMATGMPRGIKRRAETEPA